MTHWSDSIIKLNACSEAVKWCLTQPSLDVAWDRCQRGDWMIWILGRLNTSAPWSDERKPLVRVSVECSEQSLQYANSDTINATLWCLDSIRRWCGGEADRDEVDAAANAAYAAAYAAYAAARYRSLAASAKIVRRHFPKPPRLIT